MPTHGKLLNAAPVDSESRANSGRNGDLTGVAYRHLGFDDVLGPVALGCRDVSRQREVWQRRKCDVVGPAYAGLKHAATPHRNAALLRRIVDGDRLTEAADPADLDVDDLARAHIDSRKRVAAIADGFVKADRCLDALLQHGVEVEVVVPEGLLNHQQAELVPRRDVIKVLEPVGGVCIAAEHDVVPALSDSLKDMVVPAWLALQLDPLIAGFELKFNLFDQLFKRRLNSN